MHKGAHINCTSITLFLVVLQELFVFLQKVILLTIQVNTNSETFYRVQFTCSLAVWSRNAFNRLLQIVAISIKFALIVVIGSEIYFLRFSEAEEYLLFACHDVSCFSSGSKDQAETEIFK